MRAITEWTLYAETVISQWLFSFYTLDAASHFTPVLDFLSWTLFELHTIKWDAAEDSRRRWCLFCMTRVAN